MRFTLLTAALVAVALSASGEAEAASIESRDWFSDIVALLANKKYFGASGYPWQQSSTPGWYIGNVACSQPKWDGGSTLLCKTWPASWSSFCRNGNPNKASPPSHSWDWGFQGKPSWPRPAYNNGHGIKSPVKCTTTAVSTVTSVVPTTATTTVTASGTTTVVPTTTDTTVTSVVTTTATTSTTISSAVSVATGTPLNTCDDGYLQTFNNYTTVATTGVYAGQVVGAAIIDNANYLTYGLSNTTEGCLTVCDQVSGCAFVNAYLDHGDTTEGDMGGKYSGAYTCALYSICESTSAATNYGGQNDPSYITDSSGCQLPDIFKMVRTGAFAILAAVISLTGFVSAGNGHHYDCSDCQLISRSTEYEKANIALQCTRQLSAHITKFYKGGDDSSWDLSKKPLTRGSAPDGRFDVIKEVTYHNLQFHPDSHGGFTIDDFKCANGNSGSAVCTACEKITV
ncbi:hypothetical protein BCV69DRAFT_275014 [Microstroma glucosiphilum]|uniref:Apple domain-containing protein n=1 Tax=Pseudomicrostroma glucosiphilum TaxID=1684307 RepID=A0A316UEY5_9BASI|nr:hypothetical protein BCV69DRAFT_275014 [Pseudomicrostroma glucosiphilum]PWN23474.1 hypothetical protein BCV69DRAFT_275014 [Pseudomicrostroma glucosiphilum]